MSELFGATDSPNDCSRFLMENSGGDPVAAPPDTTPCEQCDKPFAPRAGGGGKPQRFCSTQCRTSFNSQNRQRGQRSESPVGETDTAAIPLADAETLISESRNRPAGDTANLPALIIPVASNEDAIKNSETKFDWNEDEFVVLRPQQAIAIYRNPSDGLVIRQERDWSEEADTYIVIAPENIEAFLDRLCDVAGIQSYGRAAPSALKKR